MAAPQDVGEGVDVSVYVTSMCGQFGAAMATVMKTMEMMGRQDHTS